MVIHSHDFRCNKNELPWYTFHDAQGHLYAAWELGVNPQLVTNTAIVWMAYIMAYIMARHSQLVSCWRHWNSKRLPLVIVPSSQLDTKAGAFIICYLARPCWDRLTLQEFLYLPRSSMPTLWAWTVCKSWSVLPDRFLQDESQGLWALAQRFGLSTHRVSGKKWESRSLHGGSWGQAGRHQPSIHVSFTSRHAEVLMWF